MERLTSARCNGIKNGYWSTAKKDELIQRLGRYEDTGFEPEEIKQRRPRFDADAAEEYISNLCSHYKELKNETFIKDNEGRERSDFITSPEHQKYLGAEIALSEVLKYFAKFDF